MNGTTKPTHQSVREFLEGRTHPEQTEPPPSPEDIRRMLGWRLIPHNDQVERE